MVAGTRVSGRGRGHDADIEPARSALLRTAWGMISAIVLFHHQRLARVQPWVDAAERRRRLLLVLKTNAAESRWSVLKFDMRNDGAARDHGCIELQLLLRWIVL